MGNPSADTQLRPSLNRLENKTAVLTGASRGIGLSITEVFAHEKANVVILDIDLVRAKSAALNLRDRGYVVSALGVDLMNEKDTEAAIASVTKEHGGIDILVNNARNGSRSDLFSQESHSWDQELSLMLKSTFHLSQLVIKSMMNRGGGSILNVSSIAHFLTVPESPAYHAAKGGVEALTRYIATSAGKYGVRANTLCPGHVFKSEQAESTPKWKSVLDKLIPLGRVPTSIEIGYTALMLCSEEASLITGQSISVDGGLSLIEQAYAMRLAGLEF